MSLVEEAQEFARKAHEGQQRKFADEPYINHLVRVKQLCETVTGNEVVLSAALLHDILEDTKVSTQDLRAFLETHCNADTAETILLIVHELTDIYVPAAFPTWNRRKRKRMEARRLATVSADAQTIKYADIIDNSQDMATADPDFCEKLLFEYRLLLKLMHSGDVTLHSQAVSTLQTAMYALGARSVPRHTM